MPRTHDHPPEGARAGKSAPPQRPILQWLSKWKREGDPSGKSRLTREQIAARLPGVPGWSVVDRNGISRLEKVFTFLDLAGSLDFAIRVGAIDESKIHQPALLIDRDRVKVSWWTISKGGLLPEDFDNAAKTNALYQPG